MKDQYSSSYDDPVIANERFKNKLDFLERESIKRENYLKDLERNFKLTKQTIKSLTQKNPARDQVITQLHQENSLLMHKLRQEYDAICRLNALYLMECQLRIEESKSYNQRIKDFQETMAELRRYLHDKEESFSFVAQKLKRFEQLVPNQQLTMYQKLVNYSAIVKEEIRWKDVFNQVLEDRDAWKKQAEESREKCKRLQIIIQGIKAEPDFAKFETFVNNLNEDQSNKLYTAIVLNKDPLPNEEAKHHANLSTNLTYSEGNKLPIEPNVELIRLMKKEKLSNKILDVALSQALDKNFELIEYNKRLIESNQTLRKEVDFIIADMVVLCEALTHYDHNYRTKLRLLKHRAKSDIDLPSYKEIINKYKNNSLSQAQEILFTKMRNDVQELTQYIAFCPLQKTNQIPSYESPRKIFRDQQKFEISMNDKQLEISQI